MAKTVRITIQLVPESQGIDDGIIGKEIVESLTCAWLYKVLTIEMNQSRMRASGK